MPDETLPPDSLPQEPIPSKRGPQGLHPNAAARTKAWRERRGTRRIDAILSDPSAIAHMDALRFAYPDLSNSDIVERILADRHARKDFVLPELRAQPSPPFAPPKRRE